MTVGELIAKLSKFPRNLQVMVNSAESLDDDRSLRNLDYGPTGTVLQEEEGEAVSCDTEGRADEAVVVIGFGGE
jgi:hypothetical protein